jgi:hypothetical protein
MRFELRLSEGAVEKLVERWPGENVQTKEVVGAIWFPNPSSA